MASTPMKAKSDFESLLEAISRNEAGPACKLLAENPHLATERVQVARLDAGLPHWIYAGDTALHAAAAGYRVEIAKALLDAGAEVNAVGHHRHAQPLHYAADGCPGGSSWDPQSQIKTLKLLVKAGANLHAVDKNGATPLHRAVRTRCVAAVKFLLEEGAEPAARNKPGSTPFHLAVQNTGRGGSGVAEAKEAQAEIISLFLQHGAGPDLKDARGLSVKDWAKSAWIHALLSPAK